MRVYTEQRQQDNRETILAGASPLRARNPEPRRPLLRRGLELPPEGAGTLRKRIAGSLYLLPRRSPTAAPGANRIARRVLISQVRGLLTPALPRHGGAGVFGGKGAR